jgi:hypothetical protein
MKDVRSFPWPVHVPAQCTLTAPPLTHNKIRIMDDHEERIQAALAECDISDPLIYAYIADKY